MVAVGAADAAAVAPYRKEDARRRRTASAKRLEKQAMIPRRPAWDRPAPRPAQSFPESVRSGMGSYLGFDRLPCIAGKGQAGRPRRGEASEPQSARNNKNAAFNYAPVSRLFLTLCGNGPDLSFPLGRPGIAAKIGKRLDGRRAGRAPGPALSGPRARPRQAPPSLIFPRESCGLYAGRSGSGWRGRGGEKMVAATSAAGMHGRGRGGGGNDPPSLIVKLGPSLTQCAAPDPAPPHVPPPGGRGGLGTPSGPGGPEARREP